MRKLGLNLGKYCGETLAVPAYFADLAAAAQAHGWRDVSFSTTGGKLLPAYFRGSAAGERPTIYISAGIHGDEPAGPLAGLQLLREDSWPAGANLLLCPVLNPDGLAGNSRENPSGVDLNRDYKDPQSPETQAHVAWLQTQPAFAVTLCLHEDWEAQGFYLYELNPDARPSFAPAMIAAVAPLCPIDLSPEIEGRAAAGGIIHPSVEPSSRPLWPEAFHLLRHHTRLSYTLEAPSDFPLSVRVAALVAAVRVVLAAFAK